MLAKVNVSDPRKSFEGLSRRWKRHWLSLLTESGLVPLPFELWLAFPDFGVLSPYQIGAVRYYILEKVRPKDLDFLSFNLLSLFYVLDPVNMGERLLVSLIRLHLEYLKWYCSVMFDYSQPLSNLIKPPVSPRKVERQSDEKLLTRYGLAFQAWDFLRSNPIPVGLDSGGTSRYDVIVVRLYKMKDGVTALDFGDGVPPLTDSEGDSSSDESATLYKPIEGVAICTEDGVVYLSRSYLPM